eukprot:4521113-Amphidinium_carterae.1
MNHLGQTKHQGYRCNNNSNTNDTFGAMTSNNQWSARTGWSHSPSYSRLPPISLSKFPDCHQSHFKPSYFPQIGHSPFKHSSSRTKLHSARGLSQTHTHTPTLGKTKA